MLPTAKLYFRCNTGRKKPSRIQPRPVYLGDATVRVVSDSATALLTYYPIAFLEASRAACRRECEYADGTQIGILRIRKTPFS